MRLARIALAVGLLAGWGIAASARAQTTAALMPETSLDAPDAAARVRARDTSMELLREEGYLVLEDTRVQASLDDDALRSCAAFEPCTRAVYARIGVEVLVGFALEGTPGAFTGVRVMVRRSPDDVHTADAAIEGDAIEAGVRRALHAALSEAEEARGPFVRVVGMEGATVELDGAPVGECPLTVRTTPGAHTVRGTLGDDVAEVTVEVPADPTQTIEVTLVMVTGAPPPSTAASMEWAVGVGAGLVAAGVVVAVLPPVISELSTGCADARCERFIEVDDVVWAWVGVGGAMVVAGTVLLAIGVASGGGDSDEDDVQVRLGPGSISVDGRF